MVQFLVHFFELLLHLAEFGESGHGFFQDRLAFRDVHFLMKVPQRAAGWAQYFAVMRVHFAGNNLEKRGFARPVASHQASFILRADNQVNSVKKDPVPVLDENIRKCDHVQSGSKTAL